MKERGEEREKKRDRVKERGEERERKKKREGVLFLQIGSFVDHRFQRKRNDVLLVSLFSH